MYGNMVTVRTMYEPEKRCTIGTLYQVGKGEEYFLWNGVNVSENCVVQRWYVQLDRCLHRYCSFSKFVCDEGSSSVCAREHFCSRAQHNYNFITNGTWETVVPSTRKSGVLKIRSDKVPQRSGEGNVVNKWRMRRKISAIGIGCEEMCGHGVYFEEESGMLREMFLDVREDVSIPTGRKGK